MNDFIEIPDVLAQFEAMGAAKQPIVGFALIMRLGQFDAKDGQETARSMLRDFAVSTCDAGIENSQTQIEWAATVPGRQPLLSTWSCHTDPRGSCFIEGDFYSGAWGHSPRVGRDSELAQRTLDRVLSGGARELDKLNGLFSGFVFSAHEGKLWIFVDRLGARLLFYRPGESGQWYVATDLYGLRHRPARLEVEPLSLNEHLTFGSPLSGKTIFRDVRIVGPGQVVRLTPGLATESPYYLFPERRPASLAVARKPLCDAMDSHVESLREHLPDRVGVAMSSGRDSRVVLAALLRGGMQAKGVDLPNLAQRVRNTSDALRLLAELQIPARVGRIRALLGSGRLRFGTPRFSPWDTPPRGDFSCSRRWPPLKGVSSFDGV